MSTPSRHDHYPRAAAPRRHAIAAAARRRAAAWRAADEAPGGLLAALDAAAADTPDAAIARLLPWLADPRWLTDRLAAALDLLAADPFARPPLRLVGGGGGPGGLILAERGALRLSLQLLPFEAAVAPPATALFVPGRAAIRVLASGGARLALHHVALTAAEEAVFLLNRSRRGHFLRANLWPAATDAAYAASGAAAFAYGLPHDHNFHFLTVGYWGPGYVSDYYEYDAERVDGRIGEPLALTFVERSQLGEGNMLLYRAHRDIHSQHPPERLSVSLNIMEEGEHTPWRDQYIVDLETPTIAKRPTLTQTEMLLRCAVHLTEEGRDIADHFASAHPVPRVRANALAALAAVEDGAGRAAVLERGLGDRDARVRDDCERWLAS